MKIDIRQGFVNLARLAALIMLLYIAFSLLVVAINVYDDLEISPELWEFKSRQSNQKVIAIISPSRPGEWQQALMVRDAAIKMGHLAYVYKFNDIDMDLFLPAKYMNEILFYALSKIFKPDVHLAISFHVNVNVPNPKIMYISVPPEYGLKQIAERYKAINNYNNFIDINLINSKQDWLTPVLNKKINSFPGVVGIPANEYKASPHNRLLLFGSLWGRRNSGFVGAIKKLAQQDYMFFIKHNFLILEEEKQKFVEEAEGLLALQTRLNEYGIAICPHSNMHRKAGVPSSRIFEIISSGAIAISDKNPFVEKYFGNNVFYYDQDVSEEEIFKQIDSHVRFLQSNPLEADKMARRAHKIVQENFTTDRFVQAIIDNLSNLKN